MIEVQPVQPELPTIALLEPKPPRSTATSNVGKSCNTRGPSDRKSVRLQQCTDNDGVPKSHSRNATSWGKTQYNICTVATRRTLRKRYALKTPMMTPKRPLTLDCICVLVTVRPAEARL